MTVFKYKNGKLVQVAGNGGGGSSSENSGSSLPVGSIFASAIPLDDAKVHLLDGSTISQTGVYADFANLVKTLVSNGYNISCTQSDFDANVSTYGQCGKFVIDNDNGNIRLPLITEFIASNNGGQTIGLAELDSFKSHEHSVKNGQGRYIQISSTSGSYAGGRISSATAYYDESNEGYTVKAQATGDSETKPKNIRYPYYIVLASGYKSTEQVNVDNIMTDVNRISAEVEGKLPLTGGVLTGEVRRNHNLFDFSKVKISSISNGSVSVDYTNKTITMTSSASDQYCTIHGAIQLKPNTRYSFKYKTSPSNANVEIYIHMPEIGYTGGDFTTGASGIVNFIRIDNNVAGNTTVYSEFMLNEGTALPYDEYYGEAVYKRQMADAFAPSNTYEDLGKSTSFEFTAPANGYVAYKGVSNSNVSSFGATPIDGNGAGVEYVFGVTGYGQERLVPVRRGVTYSIWMSDINQSHTWGFYVRFYYAQGEL